MRLKPSPAISLVDLQAACDRYYAQDEPDDPEPKRLLRATEYLIFPQFRRLKKEKAEAKSAEPDWKDKSASDVFGTLWMKLLTQLHRAHKKRVPADRLKRCIVAQTEVGRGDAQRREPRP